MLSTRSRLSQLLNKDPRKGITQLRDFVQLTKQSSFTDKLCIQNSNPKEYQSEKKAPYHVLKLQKRIVFVTPYSKKSYAQFKTNFKQGIRVFPYKLNCKPK